MCLHGMYTPLVGCDCAIVCVLFSAFWSELACVFGTCVFACKCRWICVWVGFVLSVLGK